MALIVHKYGGTSVGSPERIKNVAKRVAKARAEGHDIVVVVSAMSGETNRLVALAHEMQEHPDPRELDVVLATGEQVTIGLLAMALKDIGVDAKSYTGWQVALKTDTSHTKARIESIDDEKCAPTSPRAKSSSLPVSKASAVKAIFPRSDAAVPTPPPLRSPQPSKRTNAKSIPT